MEYLKLSKKKIRLPPNNFVYILNDKSDFTLWSVTCEFAQLPGIVLVWVIISCHDNFCFFEEKGGN
jgi:hypothetical protein